MRQTLPVCFDHRVEIWRKAELSTLEVRLITTLVRHGAECLVCSGRLVRWTAENLREVSQ